MKTRAIADLLGAELSGDPGVEIHGVASRATATKGELAFLPGAITIDR